jgi:hypothetical protein
MNGVISPGDPGCQHYMVISRPRYGFDEIGVCRYCNRKVNYTVMQQGYSKTQQAHMDKPEKLINYGTYENIVKTRTGQTAALKERRARKAVGRTI